MSARQIGASQIAAADDRIAEIGAAQDGVLQLHIDQSLPGQAFAGEVLSRPILVHDAAVRLLQTCGDLGNVDRIDVRLCGGMARVDRLPIRRGRGGGDVVRRRQGRWEYKGRYREGGRHQRGDEVAFVHLEFGWSASPGLLWVYAERVVALFAMPIEGGNR